jgi:hypothetical protein
VYASSVQTVKTGIALVPMCPFDRLVPAMGGFYIGGIDPV